ERVKSGVMRFEDYPPARLVEDSAHEMRQFAHSQKVTLSYDLDDSLPSIRCDFEQFKRALVNLIENAIKFTPSGGSVQVRAYVEGDKSGTGIVFEVSDTGVGIAPEAQPRIFDRFYRAQQRGTEHITGSGIGLSLVKAVVENHNGKIWLSSELEKGTTFYLSLPIVVKASYSQ
ncbi:MAG: HAMP domain-containing sensor histidine kinase, partial [Anaerolineae bacterium]